MQLILIVFHSRNDFTAQQCSSWTEQTGWQGNNFLNQDKIISVFYLRQSWHCPIIFLGYYCWYCSGAILYQKQLFSFILSSWCWETWRIWFVLSHHLIPVVSLEVSSNKIFVVRLWKYQPDTIGKSEYLLDSMLYETLEFDDDIFAAGEWNNSSVQSCIIWLTRGPAGLVNRAEKYLTENYLMCICQVIVMMPSSTETIHYTVPMRIVCLMARSLPRTSLLNTTTLETAQSGSTMPEQRPRR